MIAPAKKRLLNILLADDGSSHSNAAVELLTDLAPSPDSQVMVVRVFTTMDVDNLPRYERSLDELCARITQAGIMATRTAVMGSPADTLLSFALQQNPDLLVLGARGARPALGFPLGSVAVRLVEDGRWPILVVRAPYRGLKKVLLVTDGSPCSHIATNFMANFPFAEDTHFEVMHVCPRLPSEIVRGAFPGDAAIVNPILTEQEESALREKDEDKGRKVLREAQTDLAAAGIQVSKVMARGDAATEIIQYAREQQCDLIVAGSRGLGSWSGWLLGSVSRALVYRAHCSVLIARCTEPGATAD